MSWLNNQVFNRL